jgi:hypothetical protein
MLPASTRSFSSVRFCVNRRQLAPQSPWPRTGRMDPVLQAPGGFMQPLVADRCLAVAPAALPSHAARACSDLVLSCPGFLLKLLHLILQAGTSNRLCMQQLQQQRQLSRMFRSLGQQSSCSSTNSCILKCKVSVTCRRLTAATVMLTLFECP